MRSTAQVLRLITVLNEHGVIRRLQSTDYFGKGRRVVVDDERDWRRFGLSSTRDRLRRCTDET